MNKEIVKKSLGALPVAKKKPDQKPFNWKGLAKMTMFLIFIAETVKSLILVSLKGHSISSMAFELSGAVVITLAYLLLGFCIDEKKNKKWKGFRELLLLVSMLLFLYSIQKGSIENYAGESDFLASGINFISVAGTLAAFILIQDILRITPYSKVAIITFFFLFMCFHASSRPNLNTPSTYIGGLFPLLYILPLLFIQGKIAASNPQALNPYYDSGAPNLIDFVQDSIFTYDKKGNVKLQNKFFLKEMDEDQDPSDLFSKIKDATFISEEIISEKGQEKKDNSEDNNFSKMLSDITVIDMPTRTKEMRHIVNNLDESMSSPRTNFNPNLDTIIKSLYLSSGKKEITKEKILTYQGTLVDKKKKIHNLEVRIYLLLDSPHPLVIVMRDITRSSQLEEQTAAEKCREIMLSSLAGKINSVMNNSKMLLEKSLNNLNRNNTLEETKTLFVGAAQELLTPIVVAVGDIMDFCSTRKSALKYSFAPCDLKRAIQKSMKLYELEAQARQNKILFDIPNYSPRKYTICTDEKRLIQVLTRLISNSVKNTKDGTIKVLLQPYTNTFKVTVEDTGIGISPILLDKLKEELKAYQPDSLKTLHTKAGRSQGLPVAQMVSVGLGPKSLAGLNFHSDQNTGTSVWFFIESKGQSEGVRGLEALPPVATFSQYLQRHGYSPRLPSRFKMTSEYEGQDLSSSFGEVNESVEANNILSIARRPSDTSPTSKRSNLLPTPNSEGKKSRFFATPSPRDDT